ncbi:MAG: hypothetical protein AB7O24_17870 [Kofleriaceae bacterium]
MKSRAGPLASVLVACALATGCGAHAGPRPAWPDAPIELRDQSDRELATDRLWVMPLGRERDRVRDAVASAIARRIADVVADDGALAATELLGQLVELWQRDPTAVGAGLTNHVELLHKLRAMFAKSGSLEPAVQTLVLLAEAEVTHRAERLAELDEVLRFADELAAAELGELAKRAQPIKLLEPTVLALPLPWLVDRYVALLVERQLAVASVFSQQGATFALIRAHRDVIATSSMIANALGRARRPAEIHRHLTRLNGFGSDRELAVHAEIIAVNPTATAYGDLADKVRSAEHAPDPAAALAICLVGLAKFPASTDLLVAAAGDAYALERIDQAITLYERALDTSRDLDTTVLLRLGRLYGERIARLAAGGRPRAANAAWREVLARTDSGAKQRPHAVWQQTAALAESALGRGLASQGLIADARHALTASLERSPSIDAYETLTAIDVQTSKFADARRWAATGLSLLGEGTKDDRYHRAKLERLAADALRGAGKHREATARYVAGLRWWASLGETKDLPPAIAAERYLDMGRAMWWLNEPARAVELVLDAVDIDAASPTIVTGAVVFLIQTGRFRDAIDAYHRGLGAAAVGELYKIYMSLWIVGEAKRRGEPPDPLAQDYLTTRHGDTWPELIARTATGRLPFSTLAAAATTGPRQAELAFYGAVLAIDPAATTPAIRAERLRQVVTAGVVLDAEYDLARLYLAQPQ